MKDADFEILYNALSVGWHLNNVSKAVEGEKFTPEQWVRLVKWLERHNLKEHD